jgi:hypothetical protein
VTRGFLPVLPRNSGFTASANRDTLGKRPGHSDSIVSGTYELLKQNDFGLERSNFTVISTVKKCRLVAIEGD